MVSFIKYCGFFLLFVITAARAQCPSYKYQPELLLNYGYATGNEVIANVNEAIKGVGRKRTEQTYSSGPAFVTIRYYVYSCMAFGFTGGYNNQKGATIDVAGSLALTTSTYNNKVVTIALETYYIYKFRKYVDLYTYFGFGPSFTTKETDVLVTPVNSVASTTTTRTDAFSLHYTPLGVRFGGRLGGFAEIGMGYKGLFSTGLSFRFGRPWCKR